MPSDILKEEIQVISIVHIIAIIFSILLLMIYTSKLRHDKALKAMVVMQVGVIFWMLFKVLKTVAPNVSIRWSFVVCYYLFSIIFQIGLISFTYISYHKKSLPKWANISLYIAGVLQFLFVVTNPYHYTFYSYFNFEDDGWGKYFGIYTAYSYLIISLALYYGMKHFNKQLEHVSRLKKTFFALAIILPFIFHYLYINRRVSEFFRYIGFNVWFDITPIVFTIATSIFIYLTFKFEFDELSPIIRSEIVQHLDTAILVMDSAFNIIYANQKCYDILGVDASVLVSQAIKMAGISPADAVESEIEIQNQTFLLRIHKVKDVKETSYLLSLENLSNYKVLENKILEEHNVQKSINVELKKAIAILKKESKIEARTYVAKELHDVIGHSLVVAIKSLEVGALYANIDQEMTESMIRESSLVLEDGINSMQGLMNKKGEHRAFNLKKSISDRLERVNLIGIKSYFNFNGEHISLEPNVYNAMDKITQELMTNSIKHAGAKNIFIDINISAERVLLRYIDNGVGTADLVEGNGLKGIRERVSSLGGSVDFDTSTDAGFMAKVELEV